MVGKTYKLPKNNLNFSEMVIYDENIHLITYSDNYTADRVVNILTDGVYDTKSDTLRKFFKDTGEVYTVEEICQLKNHFEYYKFPENPLGFLVLAIDTIYRNLYLFNECGKHIFIYRDGFDVTKTIR